MGERRVFGGSLRKSGQESGFGKIELLDAFVEVLLGSGLDAIGRAAVRDLIKVHFQNGGFVKDELGVNGEDDLFYFAGESFLVVE